MFVSLLQFYAWLLIFIGGYCILFILYPDVLNFLSCNSFLQMKGGAQDKE